MRVLRILLLGFAVFAVFAGTSEARAGRVIVGNFSAGILTPWQSHVFKGHSHYRLVALHGHRVLQGRCRNSASALYREKRIDLTRTPILHWSWLAGHIYPRRDGRTRSGDDYALRLNVIHKSGWFTWDTQAITYVWANTQPKGSHWPNAFTDHDVMVAVESGPPAQTQHLVSESRNVRADFRRFFGENVKTLQGVALMTDCDNGGGRGLGYFGDIDFRAQ